MANEDSSTSERKTKTATNLPDCPEADALNLARQCSDERSAAKREDVVKKRPSPVDGRPLCVKVLAG
ncbi:unnamed protein product [Soboliphyme baturini]|uniref:Uncharacterized protein n=1 Tax=Soboliphyme baturini TaxID=241478 RepID=A0A183IDL2_9BILA|nr:unnamed protein product [Soboliphyme baturini]